MMLIPLKNELKWCILVCLELLTGPVTQLLNAAEVWNTGTDTVSLKDIVCYFNRFLPLFPIQHLSLRSPTGLRKMVNTTICRRTRH